MQSRLVGRRWRGGTRRHVLGWRSGAGGIRWQAQRAASCRSRGCRPSIAGFRPQDIPGDPARRLGGPEPIDRASAASFTYLPDSVIVKFKDGADRSAAVNSTLSQVSGGSADRPSSADFDIITIGAGIDPEAAAAALAARSDVEYAQPRYLNHKMYKPNDPLYSNQWNFPAIDMERAWDIQQGSGPDVIVAVLDTGVAFRSGTIRYNSRFAFRLEPGGSGLPGARHGGRALCRGAGAGQRLALRLAARLHLGRQRPGGPRRPWHPRLGHDRTTHQQQHRRRGHGLQRADHAGEGDLRDLGRRSSARPTTAPTTSSRGACATRRDNGAKVINMSLGREGGGPAPAVDDAIRYAVEQGRVRGDRVRQYARDRQPAERDRQHRAVARRRGHGRRGRTIARDRVTTRPPLRPSSCRRRVATTRQPAAAPAASCSRRSISTCSKPTTGRSRSTVRLAPIRSLTTTSRAPRWRRPTCRGSRRC